MGLKAWRCHSRGKKVGQMFPLWVGGIVIMVLMWGCEDDRKAPTVPGVPTYSQTLTIINERPSNGDTLMVSFQLRDSVTSAYLYITGTLLPEAGLSLMDSLKEKVRVLDSIIVRLSARILDLELIPDTLRTPEQNRELDSLRGVRGAKEAEKAGHNARIDSLDTRLDDRFKVGIGLDNDGVFLHPRAIFLDSSAVPSHLRSGERVVWGQGFFLPDPDASGWRGKTMRLNLARFWVADETYHPPAKPSRPSDPDALPELYPQEWISRLNPGPHSLKIFFGSPGTQTRLTVSLYLVYRTTG